MSWNQSTNYKGRPSRGVLITLIIVVVCSLALVGLQTNVVEIGRNSNYDGTVKIERDASGRMVFADNEITTPVLLSRLLEGTDTHAELLGLSSDDHAQYLNSTRHDSEYGTAIRKSYRALLMSTRCRSSLGVTVRPCLPSTTDAPLNFSTLAKGPVGASGIAITMAHHTTRR